MKTKIVEHAILFGMVQVAESIPASDYERMAAGAALAGRLLSDPLARNRELRRQLALLTGPRSYDPQASGRLLLANTLARMVADDSEQRAA